MRDHLQLRVVVEQEFELAFEWARRQAELELSVAQEQLPEFRPSEPANRSAALGLALDSKQAALSLEQEPDWDSGPSGLAPELGSESAMDWVVC